MDSVMGSEEFAQRKLVANQRGSGPIPCLSSMEKLSLADVLHKSNGDLPLISLGITHERLVLLSLFYTIDLKTLRL